VHGYSSPAHSIPWPVACSWKDGDPHCTSERIAGKGAVGRGEEKGHERHGRPAGHPAAARTTPPAQDQEREGELSIPSSKRSPRPAPSKRTKRERTETNSKQRRAGKPSAKAPAAPSLARSLFASCFFLASCGEALVALSSPADLAFSLFFRCWMLHHLITSSLDCLRLRERERERECVAGVGAREEGGMLGAAS
jgi:hypothetical protein